ncbi:MAG: hypothetical protein KJO64_08715, partial [Bacteroidia bacterium]|nr:hypothetical protein [Bacteroidia bacterium]
YRVEPIGLDALTLESDQSTIFFDATDQLSGAALNYFFTLYLKEANMEIGFSQSLRYDHKYFKTDSFNLGTSNIYPSVNGVISDYHLFVQKNFDLRKGMYWNIFAGYSLMNRGSKYIYTETYIRNPLPFPLPFPLPGVNVAVTEVKEGNFNMDAINFGVGIGANKVSFDLGVYYSMNHSYDQDGDIIIPRAKLSYRIFELTQ